MHVALVLSVLFVTAPKPVGPSVLREFCNDEATRARVFAFTPPLGLGAGMCGYGTTQMGELRLGAHTLTVVAVEDLSPTATDMPPRRSAQVAIDGQWLTAATTPAGESTYVARLAKLGPIAPSSRATYLQLVLLAERVAFPQILSREDEAALVARWPETQKALADAPAGLLPDGRTLRVWEERVDAGLAGACRVLIRHELTLTNTGAIQFAPLVRYAEGTLVTKRPCGTPLPR